MKHRRIRPWKDRHQFDDATSKENAYIQWLMDNRDFDLQQAIAYATSGGDPKTVELTDAEREARRVADMPPDVRRWYNVDRPCPFKGCIHPLHHSGPHRVVRVNASDDEGT